MNGVGANQVVKRPAFGEEGFGMKRTRLMTTVALLVALALSGCAAGKRLGTIAMAEETSEAEIEAGAPPFRDFPAEAYPEQPKAAKDGEVKPTKVETELFQAKFEEDYEVAGSGAAVGGAYRFIATQTDGESWHVKLEANYPTVAGRDYFVTYKFTSDVAGKVKFGDFQEFDIKEGENSITGNFTAKSGTSYLDLQLGMLPAFTIDFTEIEVKEYADAVKYENALPKAIDFKRESFVYEKHDQDYETTLVRSNKVVNVNYDESSMDPGVWKSKLFVRTGLVPEMGAHYRVMADVMCDQDMPFELLLNDGSVEKGYGALYGKELTAEKVTVCEAVITGNGNGDELILQFSLGEAPSGSQVIVGNVHVDKIVDEYTNALPEGFALDKSVATGEMIEELVPIAYADIATPQSFYSAVESVYEQHDDGYVVELEEGESSATLKIKQAPANPGDRGVWKVRFFAATGVELQPNTSYRVRFDLESAGNQAEYEVCFDGDSEGDYGKLYGRSLTAGGTDHIDQLITPQEGKGPLSIRLQMGKTDTAAGNTVTLKNFSVEAVQLNYENILPSTFSYRTKSDATYTNVLPDDFKYDTKINVREQHNDTDGYTQEVKADESGATLSITKAPEEGREVWKSKLLINTGVTPEVGKTYGISFDIQAEKAQETYEVCYDGASEYSYGVLYNQTLTAGTQTVSYRFSPATSDGPLVLRLQLGKTDDASGNTFTVSNLKIVEITAVKGESLLPDDFAYPVTTDAETKTVPAAYVEQEVSLSAKLVAYDGFAGDAYVADGAAKLDVTSAQSGGDLWSGRLFVGTGVTPEAGQKYLVTGTLHSNAAIDSFEILSSNGIDEDDGFNKWGNGYNHGDYGLSIGEDGTYSINKEFVAPEGLSQYNKLFLRFQIGNSPADNTISVSNLEVQKWVPEHEETTGGTTTDNSFKVEAYEGAVANLTGDGSSATATVTTPGDDWHVKLYALTGVTLEAGKTYQISFDATGAAGCTACYKNNEAPEGDPEVAFGTESIVDGPVVHTVKPKVGGPLEVVLKIGNVPANTAVKVSNFEVVEVSETSGENLMPDGLSAWAHIHEWADSDYAATLSNDDSSATLDLTAVPEDRSDWKLKMFVETMAKLFAGRKYRIIYELEANSPFDYNVFLNNGAEEKAVGEFYGLHASGTQTVEHVVTAGSDAVLNIQLMLGMSPAPNKVTVRKVKVDEVHESLVPINAWAHDGYVTSLSNTDSSASIHINAAPESGREAWKVKLFAETGAELKAGKTYRVSVDVQATQPTDYEITFNNREHEGELGALHDLHASSGKSTATYTVTPGNDAVLFLQLGLGKSGGANTVTISGVKVEEVIYASSSSVIPNYRYDTVGYLSKAADGDYLTSLDLGDSSATFSIKQAPAERHAWSAKVLVHTGIIPKADKGYRVTFDVDAAKSQNLFEVFFDGDEELAYGAMYEQQLSAGKNTITYTTMPSGANGELVMQLRFGETDSTSGNTYTISNFKFEEVTFINMLRPEIKEVCELAVQDKDGYAAQLTKAPNLATVDILSTPEKREAWKNKLFVYTGVVFEPGQKYRISFDVKSIVPTPFEICFNNRDQEKGLGGLFGLTTKTYGEYVEYCTYADKVAQLVVQLSLGNVVAPNTVFLENVKVEKAGTINLVSDTTYSF